MSTFVGRVIPVRRGDQIADTFFKTDRNVHLTVNPFDASAFRMTFDRMRIPTTKNCANMLDRPNI